MTKRTIVDENTADINATFDLLSNARRRGVLYAVRRDGAATVEELAANIASWQTGADGQAGDDGGQQGNSSEPSPADVRTSLIHSHLPRLADANVVDYDREEGTVELADAANVEPYLRVTCESGPSASETDPHSGLAD